MFMIRVSIEYQKINSILYILKDWTRKKQMYSWFDLLSAPSYIKNQTTFFWFNQICIVSGPN